MLLITFPDCTNSKEHLCFLFPMSELLRSVCPAFPGFRPKKRGNRGRIKLLVLCVGEPSCRPPASTQPQTDRRRAEAAAGLPEVWGTVLEPATAGPWKLSLSFFLSLALSPPPPPCLFSPLAHFCLGAAAPSSPLSSLRLHPPPPQSLLDLDVKASQAVWSLSAGCQCRDTAHWDPEWDKLTVTMSPLSMWSWEKEKVKRRA